MVDAVNESRTEAARAAGCVVRSMRVADAWRVAEVHIQVWREAYASLMPSDYLASLDVSDFAQNWRERLADHWAAEAMHLVGVSPAGEIVAIGSAGPSKKFYARYGFAPDGAVRKHSATGTVEVRLVRG